MSERRASKPGVMETVRSIGLVLALGLGAAACTGGQNSEGPDATPSTLADKPQVYVNADKLDFSTDIYYTPSGKRIIHHTFADEDTSHYNYLSDIFQECVAGQVVSSTNATAGRGTAASAYPDAICADGKLTLEDFSVPPSEVPAQR